QFALQQLTNCTFGPPIINPFHLCLHRNGAHFLPICLFVLSPATHHPPLNLINFSCPFSPLSILHLTFGHTFLFASPRPRNDPFACRSLAQDVYQTRTVHTGLGSILSQPRSEQVRDISYQQQINVTDYLSCFTFLF